MTEKKLAEKTMVELLNDLNENLNVKTLDKGNLDEITTEILNRQEGKETFFNLFENDVIERDQKKTLLTSLKSKTTTAVFNSISVEQRIAFLENLNDGNIVVPDNVTTNPELYS